MLHHGAACREVCLDSVGCLKRLLDGHIHVQVTIGPQTTHKGHAGLLLGQFQILAQSFTIIDQPDGVVRRVAILAAATELAIGHRLVVLLPR